MLGREQEAELGVIQNPKNHGELRSYSQGSKHISVKIEEFVKKDFELVKEARVLFKELVRMNQRIRIGESEDAYLDKSTYSSNQ